MENIRITVNTENAAFEDWREELARILRELADNAENGRDLDGLHLRDFNGNRVGLVIESR